MTHLNTEIRDKIQATEKQLRSSTDEIKQLDKVNTNLTEKSTDLKELDITSKRMLFDSTTRHRSILLLIWIKVGVIGVFILNQQDERAPILILVGLTTCISSLAYFFTSSL